MSVEEGQDRAQNGGKISLRGLNRPFRRDKDPSFDRGGFPPNSQSAAAFRRNDTWSLQTQSQRTTLNPAELQFQMPKLGSQMEGQTILGNPSPDKVDTSRQRIENLAEENAGLKLELETLRNKSEDTRDAMDKILSDLIVARSEMEAKEKAMNTQQVVLNEQNIELEHLRSKVSRLSTELQQSEATQRGASQATQMGASQATQLDQTVSTLRAELREIDVQLREKDHILRERELDWKVELHALKEELAKQQMEREKSLAELRELQAKASDQNQSRQATDASQAEAERAKAEQHLQELQQLRATHAVTQSQFDIEKATSQKYLQELQQLRAELAEIENTKMGDNSPALDQLKATHIAELAELRRMTNFFKSNSERLSKQTKEMMEENRTLKESVQTRDREVQEQGSLIQALKLQIDEL